MEEKTLAPLPDVQSHESSGVALYDRISATTIKDVTDAALIGHLLHKAKQFVNAIEPEFDPIVKAAFKNHKDLLRLRQKATLRFEEAEKLGKEKLAHFFDACLAKGLEPPKIEGVSFSSAWAGEVSDASLLPAAYLVPDLAKLLDITRVLKQETRIPGWRVVERKVISVRV